MSERFPIFQSFSRIPNQRCGVLPPGSRHLGDVRAVPDLLALLKDSDIWVRRSAAEALGILGDVHAVPHLLALLKDSEFLVRSAASKALRHLKYIQRDPSVLILVGHLMLRHFFANIKGKSSAESMFSALELVSLRTSDMMLKETPLIDPLQKHQQFGWSGLLDSLSISLGPLGIDMEKLKQWLKNR